MAGLKMVHVPYKGSAESQTATVGGQVDLTFFAFSSALPHVKATRLRAIAVDGARRNPQLPDVPSTAEVVPGYISTSWTALVAPPGTPGPVVQKLSQGIDEIVKTPEVQARLRDAGDLPFEGSRAQMEAFIREETQRWGSLIKTVGITAQ
jgi:tripartite-type tricarboxylate transporter receptor subunit TctC